MPIPRFSTKCSLMIAMLFIVSMTGCVPWARGIRSLEDTVTDWRDFVWGKRAYYQRYGNDKSVPFRDGFLEGYHEILQGGDGCIPVVPPKRYWGWKYQSAGGQAAIGDWFSGYAAGVAAAKEDGLNGLSCVPMASNYNGVSDVPIEAMPSTGNEMIPAEQLDPSQTPKPAVEPPSPSNISPRGKSTTMYLPGSPSMRSPMGSPSMSRSIPVVSSPIPFGSGTVPNMPMSQAQPMTYEAPMTYLTPSAQKIPMPMAQQLPDTTSRRSSEAPLSMGRSPVIRQPLNSPAGLSNSPSDTPMPYGNR